MFFRTSYLLVVLIRFAYVFYFVRNNLFESMIYAKCLSTDEFGKLKKKNCYMKLFKNPTIIRDLFMLRIPHIITV